MRRFLTITSALVLSFALVACGGSGDSDNTLQTGLTGTGNLNPGNGPGLQPPVPTPTPAALVDITGTGMNGREQAFVSDLLEKLNAYRANNGQPAVVWDREAAAVAQTHTANMQQFSRLTHDAPDGSCSAPTDCLAQRLTNAAVLYAAASENVARGYLTADEVMQGWIASGPHNANMLDPQWTHVGLGFREDPGAISPNVYTGSWWTQVFNRK